MQSVLNKLGHRGHSVWWLLVELCAEKLEKQPDEEFSEAHCQFTFDDRFLRDSLRVTGAVLESCLSQYAALALCSHTKTQDKWHLLMPKLLEYLDRDTKRARNVRGHSAPKIKSKDKDKDITNFENLAGKVMEGVRKFGPDDGARFAEFIGEDWPIVCGVDGGVRAFRDLPPNQWAKRNAIGMLKESAERLGEK